MFSHTLTPKTMGSMALKTTGAHTIAELFLPTVHRDTLSVSVKTDTGKEILSF